MIAWSPSASMLDTGCHFDHLQLSAASCKQLWLLPDPAMTPPSHHAHSVASSTLDPAAPPAPTFTECSASSEAGRPLAPEAPLAPAAAISAADSSAS